MENPRLIGYGNKSLPKACANYGITELEMTGLMYNMLTWKFWLGKKDFDAAVVLPNGVNRDIAPIIPEREEDETREDYSF